ncbi:hypothetical protein Pcinc_016077 [Petrolisthes cinctipes]|uniref:Uncharacterized protein n=1 Tax=Petrolisthes cinctipes TaxID=88211 RepID=A0AAE1FRT2_PETCI|nr:hypothetical protein Pcinc_016077 [Petrolisthes cinctipes]
MFTPPHPIVRPTLPCPLHHIPHTPSPTPQHQVSVPTPHPVPHTTSPTPLPSHPSTTYPSPPHTPSPTPQHQVSVPTPHPVPHTPSPTPLHPHPVPHTPAAGFRPFIY